MFSETLCSLDTGYYADTVEWCPVETFEDFLVCGTYQLLEQSDKDGEFVGASSSNIRKGDLQFYCLDEKLGRLEKLQTIETAGILDTKWLPHPVNNCPILGAVTSDGEIKLFFLKEKQLVEKTCYMASLGKLCLSLDWSISGNEDRLAILSDSGGQLTLLGFSEGSNQLCPILQWTGHEYEAWITAFDAWNPSVVYSGGDDCLLQGWDTRTDCLKPTFTSKRHEMGVSSIHCNLMYENIMASGSYDENIMVWDIRNMRVPLCSSSPGGGVWRIKWHPSTGLAMLTACMYEGFHVMKFNNNTGDTCLEKVLSYKDQSSLAYGADWCKKQQWGNSSINVKDHRLVDFVATCSFYDHALNLRKVSLCG